jgi:hypothetical protein
MHYLPVPGQAYPRDPVLSHIEGNGTAPTDVDRAANGVKATDLFAQKIREDPSSIWHDAPLSEVLLEKST